MSEERNETLMLTKFVNYKLIYCILKLLSKVKRPISKIYRKFSAFSREQFVSVFQNSSFDENFYTKSIEDKISGFNNKIYTYLLL